MTSGHGFFVGVGTGGRDGGGVGAAVRPGCVGDAFGFGDPLALGLPEGDSLGFGTKPQIVQKKRP